MCKFLIVSGVALVALLGACSSLSETADTVFMNGRVYAGGTNWTAGEALAVTNGRIVYVGSDSGATRFVGTDTRKIDLAGRMLLPGLIDAHIHPLRGTIGLLYQCNFPFTTTPDDVRKTIAGCVADQPEADWIVAGQWDSGFFERFDISSPRGFLDEISNGKAVLVKDDSLHNVWVNSKVLELAGVDASTMDPPGGMFVRDAEGVPNGVALETASKMLHQLVPDATPAQQLRAAVEFSKIANAYGITAIKSASSYEAEIAAMQAADQAGELSVHVAVSMRTRDGARSDQLDYAAIERRRDAYASQHVDTRFVKLFLDGVPTPARTAAMLAPYLPDPETGARTDGGELLVPFETLAADLKELDKRGFTVKMHAAGDRSVRIALDAIEATRAANGASGLRHELAHAGYIDPADIPRFAELDAVADLSPILWHPSPIIEAIELALGSERSQLYWPVRDLIDARANLLAGSDWPAAVPDANPWVGIEALVTRADPRGKTPGVLWGEQAITLAEALTVYTLGGARALRMDAEMGSLVPGKLANFIVLEEDLFEIPAEQISDAEVSMTWFEGRLVYEQ